MNTNTHFFFLVHINTLSVLIFFSFQLNVDDQILLLKSCCMEIMCLRAACRYDPEADTLTLHNGMRLHKSQIQQGGLAVLIEPIFDFAVGLAKLHLDKAEISLLAAVLLMQSGEQNGWCVAGRGLATYTQKRIFFFFFKNL